MWHNPMITLESVKDAYEVWKELGFNPNTTLEELVYQCHLYYLPLQSRLDLSIGQRHQIGSKFHDIKKPVEYSKDEVLAMFSKGDEFYVNEWLNSEVKKDKYNLFDIFEIATYIEYGGDW